MEKNWRAYCDLIQNVANLEPTMVNWKHNVFGSIGVNKKNLLVRLGGT